MRKRSPKTNTARTAMKIGAVKLSAVIFARGVIDSAVKNINIAAILIKPLNACNPIWLVRSIANLERSKSGKRNAKPKEIAEIIFMLCVSGSFVTGEIINVDGGHGYIY